MPAYNAIERLLHGLTLANPVISELLFDLERALFKPDPGTCGSPVIVAGLARSGSTILMRTLHDSGLFASLTYHDMPFVMAPNLWSRITRLGRKSGELQERAHQDGIKVSFESPEAFEEVFWRVHEAAHRGGAPVMGVREVSRQAYRDYRVFQAAVCKRYGKSRYLAKNNNHIMRLESLLALTTDTTVLVPFRHPAHQAHSLLRQHKLFENADDFTNNYMRWLGHHEFGRSHLPFSLGAEANQDHWLPDNPNYWLCQWRNVYTYLLGCARKRAGQVIPVCYERLCSDRAYWPAICARLDLPAPEHHPFRLADHPVPDNLDKDRLVATEDMYGELQECAARILQ